MPVYSLQKISMKERFIDYKAASDRCEGTVPAHRPRLQPGLQATVSQRRESTMAAER